MSACVLVGRLSLIFLRAVPATLSLGGDVPGLEPFAKGLRVLIVGPVFRIRSAIQLRNVALRSVVHQNNAATSISAGLPQLRENKCHPENQLSGTLPPRLTDLSVAS